MERFLHDLAAEQRRQGLEVSAIVHHHELGRRTCLEEIEGIRLCRVRSLGNVLYAPVSPTFSRHLSRLIAAQCPDVLHFHVPNASALLALSLRSARRLPWIVTWQSDVLSQVDGRLALAYRFYRPLEQRFLARCRYVLTSSPAYLDGSEALRPWRDKCFPVPLGIAPPPEPDPADLIWAGSQWRGDMLRVLCIGRLTYYKGHEYLVEAIAEAPGIQLCIVGGGQLEAPIRAAVERLGLTERVRMLGYVDDARVQSLLATCDCLVLPSIERMEAFGLVLLEAMNHGKPLLATDIPHSGPGWIVRQGPSGVVVPPRDADALAAALIRYRDQPGLRTELGTKAAGVFTERFRIERVAKEVTTFYERACGPRVTVVDRLRPALTCG